MSPNRPLSLLATVLLVLASASCSGGGNDGGVLTPTITPIGGEWGTTASESFDTCGFDPPPAFEPMLVEEMGEDAVVFTFPDSFGTCDQSVRERDGDIITLRQTDVIDVGCGYVLDQTTIIYRFTESSFSGTASHHYELLSGYCYGLPCDYEMAVSGNRCDSCWPGCVSSQTSGGSQTPDTSSSLQSAPGLRF